MVDRLYPTPTRRAWLDDAEAGHLPLLLTKPQAELKTAGWIELAGTIDGPEPMRWRLTALGRAIREVRIHVRDDGRHIVAECGDPDEPRHLGDAVKTAVGRRWLVTARGLNAAVNTVGEAREELRYMAATALAAEESSHA